MGASAIEEVAQNGYCVRTVAGPELVREVRAHFDDLGLPPNTPVYRTFVNDDRATAQAVDAFLKERFQPVVDEVLPGHRLILGTYVYKAPRGGEFIDYHQDWTFTDERSFRSILLWIPLVDVRDGSGALGVIPGSHRWTDGIRTSSQIREGPTVAHQAALEAAAQVLPLVAGQAVVYDAATLHGSGVNRSDAGRPAVILITVPVGAPVLHFIESEIGLEGFVVDDSYFTACEFESRPVGRERIAGWRPPVSSADFDGCLAEEARGSTPAVAGGAFRRRFGRVRR